VVEERIRAVLGDLGSPEVTIDRERVETVERARELEVRGSPTVPIDGADPFLDESRSSHRRLLCQPQAHPAHLPR